MPWFSRISRFADLHWIFAQEHDTTCGIGCATMAAFKVNKLTPGSKAIFDEKEVYNISKKEFGSPDPQQLSQPPAQHRGYTANDLLRMLNNPKLQMPGWTMSMLPANGVASFLRNHMGVSHLGPKVSVNPVILFVDWGSQMGHWVLVDTVRAFRGKTYITICDPWDANVHVVRIRRHHPIPYTPKRENRFDFWGKHEEYGKGANGTFNGIALFRP